MVDVVRKGMIGKLRTITTLLGGWGGNGVAKPEPQPDPNVFDYDRWLGQAPGRRTRMSAWTSGETTGTLAGGMIVDMGPHYFDFAQWAHHSELSGPVEYEGTAVWPPAEGFAKVPFEVDVEARYADGVRLLVTNGDKGVRFDGDEGWIHCSDGGDILAEPRSILKERAVPRVDWAFMGDHVRNFLDCVKSRKLHGQPPGAGPTRPHHGPLRQHLPPPGPQGPLGFEGGAALLRMSKPITCSRADDASALEDIGPMGVIRPIGPIGPMSPIGQPKGTTMLATLQHLSLISPLVFSALLFSGGPAAAAPPRGIRGPTHQGAGVQCRPGGQAGGLPPAVDHRHRRLGAGAGEAVGRARSVRRRGRLLRPWAAPVARGG